MKLKISTLFAAYLALSTIVNEKRTLPTRGKFRLARLYDQLTPEFNRVNAERNALVTKFGEEIKEAPKTREDPLGQGEPQPTGKWHVPPGSEGWPMFEAAWNEFAATELEVAAEKIPLADLGDDGSIESHEFLALLEFVSA